MWGKQLWHVPSGKLIARIPKFHKYLDPIFLSYANQTNISQTIYTCNTFPYIWPTDFLKLIFLSKVPDLMVDSVKYVKLLEGFNYSAMSMYNTQLSIKYLCIYHHLCYSLSSCCKTSNIQLICLLLDILLHILMSENV